jgi:peptide/nickel transport system substrate-binding protein
MKKTMFILLGVILAAVLVFSGCSQTSTPATTKTTSTTATSPVKTSTTSTPATTSTTAKPKYGGTFVFLTPSLPKSPGGWPGDNTGSENENSQVVLEGLIRGRVDPQGHRTFEPWLAESYQFAPDLMSLTFKLRKGIKFQDGTDFNAAAVKFNLDFMIQGKRLPNLKSIDVIDDYTARINFTYWDNSFWGYFDSVPNFMVSPTAYAKNGQDWMRNNPVGTGAFKFVSFDKDVGEKFVKNPNYWKKDAQGNQLPYLDAVEHKFVTDVTTRMAALQSGQGDFMQLPSLAALEQLKNDFKVISFTSFTYAMVYDTGNADSPFSKKEVREAVEYALDRQAIAKRLCYGYPYAATQMPGPLDSGFQRNYPLARTYDPAKAKQLLAQAGYPNGFSGTTILAGSFGGNRDLMEAISAYLLEVGIKSSVNLQPDPAKRQEDSNNVHNLIDITFLGDGGSASIGYVWNLGKDRLNDKNWVATPEFLDLMKKVSTTAEEDPKAIQNMCDYLVKDALVTPVMRETSSGVMGKYVEGTGFGVRNYYVWQDYETIWLNK